MQIAAIQAVRAVPQSRSSTIRRLSVLVAIVAAICVASVVVRLARWGPDWPAQEFRAWTASHAGLTAWSNNWYGGQALPGYSLVYPPVSALLGAGLTGLCAVVLATVGAALLAPRTSRWRRTLYLAAVVGVLNEDLLIGQVPYLLGVAAGVWALWAVIARRPKLAATLALGCALASPLVGAFVLIGFPGVAASVGLRRASPLLCALGGIGTAAVLGGAEGPFPFGVRTVVSISVFVALTMLLSSREATAVRYFAASYALAAVILFVIPNPVGGNLARLGELVALPLACHYLRTGTARQRQVFVIPVLLLAVVWPGKPFLSSLTNGRGDPSQAAGFYTGFDGFLAAHQSAAYRTEVVFTRNHWEAYWVARSTPIARGWERQTDLRWNAVLYHPLTSAIYRKWLADNAISFVALPSAPIDYGGNAEAALLRTSLPPYLRPVWHDAHWTVWQVAHPTPIVTGAARLTALDPSSTTVDFTRPGSAEVRIRYSWLWSVQGDSAVLRPAPDGWMYLSATSAGPVVLKARIGTDRD